VMRNISWKSESIDRSPLIKSRTEMEPKTFSTFSLSLYTPKLKSLSPANAPFFFTEAHSERELLLLLVLCFNLTFILFLLLFIYQRF
jgi:hypothetical protein